MTTAWSLGVIGLGEGVRIGDVVPGCSGRKSDVGF
jgi:hypothetical protein